MFDAFTTKFEMLYVLSVAKCSVKTIICDVMCFVCIVEYRRNTMHECLFFGSLSFLSSQEHNVSFVSTICGADSLARAVPLDACAVCFDYCVLVYCDYLKLRSIHVVASILHSVSVGTEVLAGTRCTVSGR